MSVNVGKGREILSKTFMESHKDITEDRAQELVVKSELEIRKLREAMASDEKLIATQELLKDLKGGYTSTIKYEEAKIQFLLGKIEEIQGDEVNPYSSTK